MLKKNIPDTEIPAADPAEVVKQYEPLIFKIANRYSPILDRSGAVGLEDLEQAGRLAVLHAQSKYDPEGGASFFTYSSYWIRSAIRRALEFDSHTGELPPRLDYLDEPITDADGNETARIDLIPDPSILPFDEPLIEAETRQETAVEVRAALDRLKNDRQRDIIQHIYFDGQARKDIAANSGVSFQLVSKVERQAYRELRTDAQLRHFVGEIPFFHVSAGRYNTTWTSAVEAAVIWREEHLRQDINNAPDEPDTGRTWTAAQWQSYIERIRRKWDKPKTEPVQDAI